MTIILETTDAPETTATPYSMHSGDEFWGHLTKSTGDWVKVSLAAGSTYTFGAVGVGATGTGVRNTQLVLHAADGSVISSDDNSGPGLSSTLTFTAGPAGDFYVEVRSLGGAAGAAYGLAMTEGDRVSYGVQLGAAEIYRTGGSWSATPATGTVVTYGFRDTDPGTTDASGHAAPFSHLTTDQMVAAQVAFGNYSSVSNISFQQVNDNAGLTDNATILIGGYTSSNDGSGAYTYFPGSTDSASHAGDMWINQQYVSGTTLPDGSYSQFVFLHELGHAMGLSHPGDYNAQPGVSITYDNSAQFAEDSQQYSVMSYFQATATDPGAPHHYPQTLMTYDIYAVQQLYGVNSSTNAGNSVYGFHSNVGGPFDFSANASPLLCIWDGAGHDTLNVSGFTHAQKIDLNDGHFSDIGAYTANVSIAYGCKIENAVGGSGSDMIIGNDLANRLSGFGGNDTLIGGAGNDRLTGNSGADTFVFAHGSGRDTITDFDNATDVLSLASSLWGGAVLTAVEVVTDYARIVAGHVVLDFTHFGADVISLLTVNSVSGLDAHIQVV